MAIFALFFKRHRTLNSFNPCLRIYPEERALDTENTTSVKANTVLLVIRLKILKH